MNTYNVQTYVLIGAGNLASHLGRAMKRAGYRCMGVYSRTEKSASALAVKLDAPYTTQINALPEADTYIFSVKDSVLSALVMPVARQHPEALFLHTAGSLPVDVFHDCVSRYGVLYPMQTFSKQRNVDFLKIPCFVEGCTEAVTGQIRELAGRLSEKVFYLSSDDRRYLHLAAVFACNFANFCYSGAEYVLRQRNIPFSVLRPLIDETAAKVCDVSPVEAQTGPAVRYDENVMKKQLEMLYGEPHLQAFYKAASEGIHEFAKLLEKNK